MLEAGAAWAFGPRHFLTHRDTTPTSTWVVPVQFLPPLSESRPGEPPPTPVTVHAAPTRASPVAGALLAAPGTVGAGSVVPRGATRVPCSSTQPPDSFFLEYFKVDPRQHIISP